MVQVKVTEGLLEGVKVENKYGGSFYSFKGIPFAQPPLGELRFKAPQPLKPWKGVRSAKEHGPICYQLDAIMKTPPQGSEDCLYLNVYTPEIKPTSPLPVMVWIHGGGFFSGSGNDELYGPEFLVRNDVILVTINYRVGALGFLSLDTEDVPGNAGMKDQVAALRWVKENIKSFGGDPDKITIFGESAGGASVTFHLVSPMSKGLFKRAIAQSGAATNSWPVAFQPRERARALAKTLGCDTDDDKELYEFFKTVPVEKITGVKVPMTFLEHTQVHHELVFTVVEEKQFGNNEVFYSKNVYENLRTNVHEGVEVIAGYVQDEGIIGLAMQDDIDTSIAQCNDFPEIFAPKDILYNFPVGTVLEIGRRLKKFYFGNEPVSKENIDQFQKYLSMHMFTYGIIQWQKFTSVKNKTFLYKFTCQSERNWLGHVLGANKILGDRPMVCHADDIAYLFTLNILQQNIEKDSETFKLIDTATKLWTNFAKYGDPTPDSSLGVKWEPFTNDNQQYLEIGNKLKEKSHPEKEELLFWESIYEKYLPYYLVDKN